jgi:hypothetical protein
MKSIFLILLVAALPLWAAAQADAANRPDSLSLIADTIPDTNEAGGINAAEADSDNDKTKSADNTWIYALLGGLVAGGIVTALAMKLSGKKAVTATPEPREEPVAETAKGAAKPAEVRKLKQDLKNLEAQLASLQANNAALEKNLDIYRNFDSSYFGEAFRKLIVPVNEALETGSRKDIMEHLLKIMSHFSSLTRYKIAKKQPYDETNIHYLLNQKGANEAAVTEINADTPIDKIPKPIKTIADMLKEQGSKGLDDSIIAGYKIKNL